MTDRPTATVLDRSGSLVCRNAPLTVQGERFVLEMDHDTASYIWDGQQQEYTLKTNNKQLGNFTAICTNFIPTPGGKARCFFVKSEFLPQQ